MANDSTYQITGLVELRKEYEIDIQDNELKKQYDLYIENSIAEAKEEDKKEEK